MKTLSGARHPRPPESAGQYHPAFLSDNGGLSTVSSQSPITPSCPTKGQGMGLRGGIRVPLIMDYPGLPQSGRTISEL